MIALGDVGVEELELQRSLALARKLVSSAKAFAAQLGLPELGDIQLPRMVGADADQAGLRAAAALYLASELESARLVPAMEVIAGTYASGGLRIDVGPAGSMLLGIWHHRNQRFAKGEREAFFARLFGRPGRLTLASSDPGGARNERFEPLLIDLAEAIYRHRPAWPYDRGRGRPIAVAMAAESLLGNLAPRTLGMTVYAAGDIVTAIREAVAVFSHERVQAALGASSMWGAVRNATRDYLNERVDLEAHVQRGQAGQTILAWLADVAPVLGAPDPGVRPDESVVAAAARWLEVSLALAERQPAVVGR